MMKTRGGLSQPAPCVGDERPWIGRPGYDSQPAQAETPRLGPGHNHANPGYHADCGFCVRFAPSPAGEESSEVERLRREALEAETTSHEGGELGLVSVLIVRERINQLADAARRQRDFLADAAAEAMRQRDEARRLHDEHCSDTYKRPIGTAGCVPPWRR